jgi:hypothetical protein
LCWKGVSIVVIYGIMSSRRTLGVIKDTYRISPEI